MDHSTIRKIISYAANGRQLTRAAEVGCGYGRVIGVLKEFADHVIGFEREPHLVEIATRLRPDIQFKLVDDLATINAETMDFMMTCTVLQHLTDEHVRKVCARMREMTPKGHVLLIEKTDTAGTSANQDDGSKFLSRARSIEAYSQFMSPFRLVETWDRMVEPTYHTPKAATCMLFAAPE